MSSSTIHARTTLSEIVIHSDDYEHLNFDLVPSHKHMGLARDWMDDASARLSLKTALKALVDDGYDYDFMLIDCPPDLSVLTDAAFIAALNVFLTAQTQATSRDALDDLWGGSDIDAQLAEFVEDVFQRGRHVVDAFCARTDDFSRAED